MLNECLSTHIKVDSVALDDLDIFILCRCQCFSSVVLILFAFPLYLSSALALLMPTHFHIFTHLEIYVFPNATDIGVPTHWSLHPSDVTAFLLSCTLVSAQIRIRTRNGKKEGFYLLVACCFWLLEVAVRTFPAREIRMLEDSSWHGLISGPDLCRSQTIQLLIVGINSSVTMQH